MTCIAITEKKHGLDPYPSYYIQIQKMRITKINEMPHPFLFTERGLELRAIKPHIKDYHKIHQKTFDALER